MTKEEFINKLKLLNITLTENQLVQLDNYYKLLVSYNEKINLTSITKEEDVYLKHFYDSLTLIRVIDLNEKLFLCDLGTGAGFPGIVLKIVFPNLKITLIDSTEKKIKFLNEVIAKLELENIEAITTRIEDYAKSNKEKYDILVSRAVAKINVLLELGCNLLKVNGSFIFMKGNVKEELIASKNALSVLNFELIKVISFALPVENSERNLVYLRKTKSNSDIYPRDFTKIKKYPL